MGATKRQISGGLNQCPNTYNPNQTDVNHDGCEDEQGGGTGGDIQLAELHIYGRSRLGMMKPEGVTMASEENRVSHNVDVALEEHNSVYVRRVNRKQYELTDHLGNVRVVITDVKTTSEPLANDKPQGPYKATLLASNNYYPFGMLQPERHWSTEEYRYGYNGKEMDNEASGNGNQYDYGFRIYNPRIAKFLSVDPLTKDYPELTPYQFARNTPIWAVDLDGLEAAYITTKTRTGATIFDTKVKMNIVNQSSVALSKNDLKIVMEVLTYSVPTLFNNTETEREYNLSISLTVAQEVKPIDFVLVLVDVAKDEEDKEQPKAAGRVDWIGETKMNRLQLVFTKGDLQQFKSFWEQMEKVKMMKKRGQPKALINVEEELLSASNLPGQANTFGHELGHALGLFHTTDESNLLHKIEIGTEITPKQHEEIIKTIDRNNKEESERNVNRMQEMVIPSIY